MKKLKTAVVGLGMGLSFHIPRIIEHENYELTAMKAEKLPKSPKFVETENTDVSKV